MTDISRRQQSIKRRDAAVRIGPQHTGLGNALIATATIAATISIAACSMSTPNAGPTTTTVSKPAVDGAGNVYVVDNSGFGEVVKLEAG